MTERHVASLSLALPATAAGSERPGAALHVTPVGFTYDADARVARVITFASAKKARLIEQFETLPAALSQVDGRRWLTLYGEVTVSSDPAVNADAERRYAQRYRPPGDRGADRRTIIMDVERMVGWGASPK